ncbi:MAG: acyl transferase [Flammeovirgaceae bacterium]|nr:acyl transferase [Flammeovirgaceae bacterium]
MEDFKSFESLLYPLNDRQFEDIALRLFRFQLKNNPVYNQYVTNLHLDLSRVSSIQQIPFLPISFFKYHRVITGQWSPEVTYRSSGTTIQKASEHAIWKNQLYLDHALRCFETFYGDIRNYHLLALLPSYLERKDSSLVAMIDYFIKQSQSELSGFYLHNVDELLLDIDKAKRTNRKLILWGVTFALLDFAEQYQPDLENCIVFETGGMKGRRNEITRLQLHEILKKNFNVENIYSEYGMTELLSQAYRKGDNFFTGAPSMRVLGREINDPLKVGVLGETCALNVIDLANFHSVAFIETEDLGLVNKDGTFDVLGRLDNSDARGCNLLIA